MTYVASLIAFGSYIFPVGSAIKSRETSSDIDETKMLGLDGTIAPPGKAQAHIVTVTIDIGGGGDVNPITHAVIDTIDDLNAAVNDLYGFLATGYAFLTVSQSGTTTILAQKRKFQVNYLEGSGRRHAEISIEFYCPDPRWLNVTPGSSTTGGTIASAGTVRTYPKCTFTQSGGAASTNPELKINPAGGGAGYIAVIAFIILNDGDVLVIDCDPRNRAQAIMYTPSGGHPTPRLDLLGTSGLVNTIGDDATFPYMDPGNNVVTLAGASSFAFSWQDAFGL